jgi:hypothetical protein
MFFEVCYLYLHVRCIMPIANDWFCIDRILPPEREWEALQMAIRDDPENVPSSEAAVLRRKRWPNGSKLHVAFSKGTPPDVQKNVMSYALQWCEYANIDFVFDNARDAQIRITFTPEETWSYVGRDALSIPPDEPTMNFGWLIPASPEKIISDEVYSSAVLHEFGHALGLIHEHQSPKNGIKWNRAEVLTAHQGYPEEWVEHNIFRRYHFWQSQYSQFDPYSIMLYRILPSWTRDGFATLDNVTLSPTDKDFIQRCYPGRS